MMLKQITLGLTAGALCALAFSLPAHAVVTDSFCGPSSGQGCEAGGEQMVFLQSATGVMSGFGNVGGQFSPVIMDIHSDGGMLSVLIDLKNGFATIKPNNGISFNGIDITIPGYEFTSLIFDDQLTPNANPTFTIQGFNGAHVSDGTGTEFESADTDKEYSITAIGGRFDEVDIRTLTGFDEIKHIEVGGLCKLLSNGSCDPVTVPEPGTLATLGASLAMFGGLLWWRKRKVNNDTLQSA